MFATSPLQFCYYAQTFPTDPTTHKPSAKSVQPLLDDWVVRTKTMPCTVSIVIYLSSLHVGTDPTTGAPYLHLNDDNVDTLQAFFADVQQRCAHAQAQQPRLRVELRAMLGGAGGAYTALFADFAHRYLLVRDFCTTHADWLKGLDLDIEEPLDDDPSNALDKACTLIRRLHADLPTGFALTMAPVAYSLTAPEATGMGNFCYHTLVHQRPEGALLRALNVQAYGCYTKDTFDRIVRAGYDPSRLVFGMLGDENGAATDFGRAMTALADIRRAYPSVGGAILWEYGDTQVDPIVWGEAVVRALMPALQAYRSDTTGVCVTC